MITLQLTDIKLFMNHLLKTEMFDSFLLPEATIAQDATIIIDGHRNDSYYTKEELAEQPQMRGNILPFSELRSFCYQVIASKKTPVSFRFTFQLSPSSMERVIAESYSGLTREDVSTVYIHLQFKNNSLTLTTGIAYRTFLTTRIFDEEWDVNVRKFLKKHGISYEEIQ
ncbi:MAG: DUF5721 family protein [Lachnospiraceae bacterium]